MNKKILTDEQYKICSNIAHKLVDTLNGEIDALYKANEDKYLPPFTDTILLATAIFTSYPLLKLKSMSQNDKDEEIKQLFTHYCQAVFDLVNNDHWQFDYEH